MYKTGTAIHSRPASVEQGIKPRYVEADQSATQIG